MGEKCVRLLFENVRDGTVIGANGKACEIHDFARDAIKGANIGMLEPEERRDNFRECLDRVLSDEPRVFEAQQQ